MPRTVQVELGLCELEVEQAVSFFRRLMNGRESEKGKSG
jgi:hypothetical protein